MVKVTFAGIPATLQDYHWSCPELPNLERLLNAALPAGGPSPADPNPDLNAAKKAVAWLGGTITDPGPAPVFDPQAIY